MQEGCLYKNARAGSFPKELPGKVVAKPLVWDHWCFLFCLLLCPWLKLSHFPSPANVSPSETLQGSIESQGPPLGPSVVVSRACVEPAAPRAPPAFPEMVLQHVGHGSRARVLSQLGCREVSRSIQFGEEMEARREHSLGRGTVRRDSGLRNH